MDDQTEIPRLVNRASFGQRLGAYVIDSIILAMVGSILRALFFPDTGRVRGEFNFSLQDFLLSALLSVLYFSLLEGSPSGQTVGKRLFRIRVVDFETGMRVDYRRALARSIGKILSGVPLGLGYLWMLWDPNRQTWHDKLSYTTVADARPPVEP